MQGKIKRAFNVLWHDRLMATTHKHITLGTSFLQGIWSVSATANDARAYPDRRLSVCETGCVTKTKEGKPSTASSAREPGARDKSDGLLGSLLADAFFGAVFSPLLPAWAQSADWSNLIDGADEIWMDRRAKPAHLQPPAPARMPTFF